jgi:hypothetical protein
MSVAIPLLRVAGLHVPAAAIQAISLREWNVRRLITFAKGFMDVQEVVNKDVATTIKISHLFTHMIIGIQQKKLR